MGTNFSISSKVGSLLLTSSSNLGSKTNVGEFSTIEAFKAFVFTDVQD